MNIVGANVGTMPSGKLIYDGGCCLFSEGKLRMAVAEERVSRKKYAGGYKHSLPYILERSNVQLSDIDLIVLSTYGDFSPRSLRGRYELPELEQVDDRIVVIPSHHLAHAYSAFIPSPFEEALILVMDNEGNLLAPPRAPEHWQDPMERVSIYIGRGCDIQLLERDMDEADVPSLGEVYGNFTSFLGLGNYLNAGKTMGLAAYGRPERFEQVELFEMCNGRMRSKMRNCYGRPNAEFVRFFQEEYGFAVSPRLPTQPIETIHEDLAYLIQDRLEKIVVERVQDLVAQTGLRNLCLAGGVALNCVLNRKLLDETPIEKIWIQPSSGDPGLCYGNALYGYHVVRGKADRTEMIHASYGGAFSDEEILIELQSTPSIRYHQPGQLTETMANLIAQGNIVGWFQGASEFGPRALGNRSILTDPRRGEMKDVLNKAKHRESFRPFAPSVLLEDANEYFDLTCPSPFMLLTGNVHVDKRLLVPAITHVDGTARVQTVTFEQNPLYYELIAAFKRTTGIPLILNTSFNLADEPIVETPRDALKTFLRSEIDCLALGSYAVVKV